MSARWSPAEDNRIRAALARAEAAEARVAELETTAREDLEEILEELYQALAVSVNLERAERKRAEAAEAQVRELEQLLQVSDELFEASESDGERLLARAEAAEARVRELEERLVPLVTGQRSQQTRYIYGPVSERTSQGSITYGVVGERSVPSVLVACRVCGHEWWQDEEGQS